jgi:hypothetical protein
MTNYGPNGNGTLTLPALDIGGAYQGVTGTFGELSRVARALWAAYGVYPDLSTPRNGYDMFFGGPMGVHFPGYFGMYEKALALLVTYRGGG